MDAELQTLVNLPVVLVHRKDLYVIVAVLGVAILGCACILTYSFTNNTRLRRSAEMLRAYIASKDKENEPPRTGVDGQPTSSTGPTANRLSATVKQAVPLEARYEARMAMQAASGVGVAASRSPDKMSAVPSRLEVFHARRAARVPRRLSHLRGEGRDSPPAAAPAKKTSIEYSIDVANVD